MGRKTHLCVYRVILGALSLSCAAAFAGGATVTQSQSVISEAPGAAGGATPTTTTQTTTTTTPTATFCTGCGFGAAIVWNRYSSENVVSASTHSAGGPVIVDNGANSSIGLWLEAHYWLNHPDVTSADRGFGPFIAVQTATSGGSSSASGTVFSSFGLGFMIGLRQPAQGTQVKTSTPNVAAAPGAAPAQSQASAQGQMSGASSWNIGIGIASTQVQKLGDGIVAGQPLPTGVSTVYYKQTRVYSPFIIFSWSFE